MANEATQRGTEGEFASEWEIQGEAQKTRAAGSHEDGPEVGHSADERELATAAKERDSV